MGRFSTKPSTDMEMLLVSASVVLAGLVVVRLFRRNRKSRVRVNVGSSADTAPDLVLDTSILTSKSVQRSLASGAPPIPWVLRNDDREAMAQLAAYFSRAIPTPTSDGRVSVRECPGHGGPELQLYVPVLSTKSPVAVLARSWDPDAEDLEALLFFFGAVNPRVSGIVSKLGFERREPESPDRTVFRNRRRFARQRAG